MTINWRKTIEYTTVGALAVAWLAKLILWFTPIKFLTQMGISKNYIIGELLFSMILGSALLIAIYYQRSIYSSPKMFWGSAVAATTLATAQLLILLILGLGARVLGIEGQSL